MDTSGDEREALYKKMTPGLARILRVLIAAEPEKTRIPKPAKPQSPEVKIGGTVAKHPAIKNVGSQLAPAQEAADFFAKSKFEAAAAGPPYTSHPAPKLMESHGRLAGQM